MTEAQSEKLRELLNTYHALSQHERDMYEGGFDEFVIEVTNGEGI